MGIFSLGLKRLEHIKNQKMTREAFLAKRERKWRKFVKYVHAHSPYFQNIIQNHNIDLDACQPEDFPIMTKKDLMDNFDQIVTDRNLTRKKVEDFLDNTPDPRALLDGKYVPLVSSGSSGHPGIVVYSTDSLSHGSVHSLRVSPSSLRKRIAFFGVADNHYAGAAMSTASENSFLKHLFKSMLINTTQPMDEVVSLLNGFQPTILTGYVSSIARLAEQQTSGALNIAPTTIMCSAEPLDPLRKEQITQAFGIVPTNTYSCTEHLVMGLNAEGYGGIYLLEDDLIFEIQDEYTCITNLLNPTTPLIRYKMGDILVPIQDTVKRYPFIKIKEIVGRVEISPTFTNNQGAENTLDSTMIIGLDFPNVKQFQLQVLTKDSFRLQYIPSSEQSDEEKADTESVIKEKIDDVMTTTGFDNLAYTIEAVGELPVNPTTRKFQVIVPAPTE